MPRYFIEVAYKGTGFSGFQIQQNANSIQAEVEKALKIYYRRDFNLTGSSRTDAGVHALQNYFHFDAADRVIDASYQLNAILPDGIVVKKIVEVNDKAHCRFDAVSREYRYDIYGEKNPFISDWAYYYPYALDREQMNEAAKMIMNYTDFISFSKRNTQVRSYECSITQSEWEQDEAGLHYKVRSNRFLRGMVKGLVGTMLQVGRGKLSLSEFTSIIESGDPGRVDFSVPSHGLFLVKVEFN